MLRPPGHWFRNIITGEPCAYVVGTLSGEPTNQMERDALAFQRYVAEAREAAGTDDFWFPYTEARRLHARWWRRGLGLMKADKLESLRRLHFNELFMPIDSRATIRFWEVYNQVEDLMYPTRDEDGKREPVDDAKIRELIAELRLKQANSLQQNGRAICAPTIIKTIAGQHGKEAAKRGKARKAFHASHADVPTAKKPILKATGS